MKRAGIILCLCGSLLSFCAALHAQSYHIYRPLSRIVKEPSSYNDFPKIEPVVSAVISGAGIEDGAGKTPVSCLYGGRGGAYVVFSPYITLGVEGTALKGSGNAGLFPVRIQKKGASLVYRGSLSSFGEPEFYWLAGMGMMSTRASVGGVRMGDVDWKGLWWTAGAGVKWELFEPCRLTAEYRLNYEPSPSQSYVLTGVKWRQEFSFGVSWTF